MGTNNLAVLLLLLLLLIHLQQPRHCKVYTTSLIVLQPNGNKACMIRHAGTVHKARPMVANCGDEVATSTYYVLFHSFIHLFVLSVIHQTRYPCHEICLFVCLSVCQRVCLPGRLSYRICVDLSVGRSADRLVSYKDMKIGIQI